MSLITLGRGAFRGITDSTPAKGEFALGLFARYSGLWQRKLGVVAVSSLEGLPEAGPGINVPYPRSQWNAEEDHAGTV